MKFVIYAIVDPASSEIIYVGHTSRLDLRREQHIDGGDTVIALKIKDIVRAGDEPIFIKLEACATKQGALMAEIFWIELLRGRGCRLANCQAFSGYADREDEKRRLRQELGAGSRIDQMVALANGRPVREGRRWSRKEDEMMRRLLRDGASKFEVADKLSRSVGAIEQRQAVIRGRRNKEQTNTENPA